MINATNKTNDYKPIEAGTYAARCFSMIHIGTIQETYMNEIKEMNKIRISWELPLEIKSFKEGEPEKPLTISREFTLSMHEKANLRKFLSGWIGKDFTEEEAENFDVTKLLGKECMLSVIHKTSPDGKKTYAVINSATTVPKGYAIPVLINELFEFNYENFNVEKFNSMPDFLKDKIRKSKEYQLIQNPENTELNELPQQIFTSKHGGAASPDADFFDAPVEIPKNTNNLGSEEKKDLPF